MKTTVLLLCVLIPNLLALDLKPPSNNNPTDGSGSNNFQKCPDEFFKSGCLPISAGKPTEDDLQTLYDCLIASKVPQECKDALEDMKVCHDLVKEKCGEPSINKKFRECIRADKTREALDNAGCQPPRHRGPSGTGNNGPQTEFTVAMVDLTQLDNIGDEEKAKCREIAESLCGNPKDDREVFNQCIEKNQEVLDAAGCKQPKRPNDDRNGDRNNEADDDGCKDQIKSVCHSKDDFPQCALKSDKVDQKCKNKIQEQKKCQELVESLCGKPSGPRDETFRNCMDKNKAQLDQSGCKPPRNPRN